MLFEWIGIWFLIVDWLSVVVLYGGVFWVLCGLFEGLEIFVVFK